MKTRTWLALAVVAVAIVTAIALAPAVLAQGPASGDRPGPRLGRMMDATPGPGYGMGPRGHMGPTGAMHGRMGGPQQSLVAAAATSKICARRSNPIPPTRRTSRRSMASDIG